MRSLLALLAAGAALTLTAVASAQAPTVLSAQNDPGQTINQLLVSGFGYTVTTNAPITFTAQLTTKVKGHTILLTKSIREESNAGQTGEPVRYSLVYAKGKAAKTLRGLKRASVTLTVDVNGADGFHQVVTATSTLKKAG